MAFRYHCRRCAPMIGLVDYNSLRVHLMDVHQIHTLATVDLPLYESGMTVQAHSVRNHHPPVQDSSDLSEEDIRRMINSHLCVDLRDYIRPEEAHSLIQMEISTRMDHFKKTFNDRLDAFEATVVNNVKQQFADFVARVLTIRQQSCKQA